MKLPNSVACSTQGQRFSGCLTELSPTQPLGRFSGLFSSSSKPGRSGLANMICAEDPASHSADTTARSEIDPIPQDFPPSSVILRIWAKKQPVHAATAGDLRNTLSPPEGAYLPN